MSTQPLDRIAPGWRDWDADAKRRLVATLEDRLARQLQQQWHPYPWQRPHLHPEDRPPGPCDPSCLDLPDAPPMATHGIWLQMGGRGTGKTDGSAHYVLRHVNGPPCSARIKGGHRVAIIGPTLGDAVESCITGLSGLQAYDPRVRTYSSPGGTYVAFPNGARGKVFGANSPNDVERLRAGGNRCLVWVEEAAAQRQLAGVMQHSKMGLRVGPNPHYVISTTPKVRPEVRKLLEDRRTVMTWGRTQDAHHLDASVREALETDYEGTRIGRQELGGELLADVEGALWRLSLIDASRVAQAPELSKVVVAVDPNAGGPDECGIVVVGRSAVELRDLRGRDTFHAYVLADLSDHYATPGDWAKAAVGAYHLWGADAIVAETNNGGDMVGHTVHTVDEAVRYRSVTATRGKAVRAEPVVGLYEVGRVHHVGIHPRLEDQQTTWTDDSPDSPDRMDALVWGVWDQLLRRRGGFASAS